MARLSFFSFSLTQRRVRSKDRRRSVLVMVGVTTQRAKDYTQIDTQITVQGRHMEIKGRALDSLYAGYSNTNNANYFALKNIDLRRIFENIFIEYYKKTKSTSICKINRYNRSKLSEYPAYCDWNAQQTAAHEIRVTSIIR